MEATIPRLGSSHIAARERPYLHSNAGNQGKNEQHIPTALYLCREIITRQRMYLYLFNPDNDMAMGNNSAYYRAPASALKMASDLACLPAWLAPPGESLIAVPQKETVRQWMSRQDLAPDVEWTTPEEGIHACRAIRPWGWNTALVNRLKQMNAAESLLPDDTQVARIRQLSSRVRAVELLSGMAGTAGTCGASRACGSLEEIDATVKTGHDEWQTPHRLLKAPWSGSGKGIRRIDERGMDVPTRNWCRRLLATQQAVIVEPRYRRMTDFAMEFYADKENGVSFIGYSLFQTDEKGTYRGNLLMSDERIMTELSRYVPTNLLEEVKATLQARLSTLLHGDYAGCLGVDMMICRFDSEPCYRLHPCVEINLRMNMGVVAHGIYARWIAAGSEGIFRVEHFSSAEQLQADHRMQKEVHPLTVRDGRIIEGYLPLTPITADSVYRAAVWAHPVNG